MKQESIVFLEACKLRSDFQGSQLFKKNSNFCRKSFKVQPVKVNLMLNLFQYRSQLFTETKKGLRHEINL